MTPASALSSSALSSATPPVPLRHPPHPQCLRHPPCHPPHPPPHRQPAPTQTPTQAATQAAIRNATRIAGRGESRDPKNRAADEGDVEGGRRAFERFVMHAGRHRRRVGRQSVLQSAAARHAPAGSGHHYARRQPRRPLFAAGLCAGAAVHHTPRRSFQPQAHRTGQLPAAGRFAAGDRHGFRYPCDSRVFAGDGRLLGHSANLHSAGGAVFAPGI